MWTDSNRKSMLKLYFAYKNKHFIEFSKTSLSSLKKKSNSKPEENCSYVKWKGKVELNVTSYL